MKQNISAQILADSINPAGVRLTSFLLRYPRFIHSELMTHRAFSRNAASSRAIPFEKMMEAVNNKPARPEFWAAEHKGMKATQELGEDGISDVKTNWECAANDAVYWADELHKFGLAKSLCNRLLEPFAHITVLVTATEAGLANFFALRAHKDAMPEFQVLAYRMLALYAANKPNRIGWGKWHIPAFEGKPPLIDNPSDDYVLKIATARCARLSYLTFDGEHDPAKDIELHDRLATSGHFSPFEHCAQAKERIYIDQQSNFDVGYAELEHQDDDSTYKGCGWLQYRKTLANECVTKIDPAAILATKPDWITL